MNKVTVVKSNDLIDASYRLTLNEQRLVLMCIGAIKRGQFITNNSKFKVSAAEFAEYFDLPLNNAYKELQGVAEKLYERSINIKHPFPDDPKVTHIKTRWVSSITYLNGSAEIILCFAQDVIPYISMLEGRFTRYSLHAVTGMNSSYGMRFYELIRKWMSTPPHEIRHTKEIALDELKEMLELKGKYKAIKDFKLKVLEPAMKDINTFSDIRAHYTQRKTGRRITHLIFYFKPDEQLKLQLPGSSKKVTQEQIEKHARPGETYEQARKRLVKNL